MKHAKEPDQRDDRCDFMKDKERNDMRNGDGPETGCIFLEERWETGEDAVGARCGSWFSASVGGLVATPLWADIETRAGKEGGSEGRADGWWHLGMVYGGKISRKVVASWMVLRAQWTGCYR